MSDQLEPWEKPGINDFRGLNRARSVPPSTNGTAGATYAGGSLPKTLAFTLNDRGTKLVRPDLANPKKAFLEQRRFDPITIRNKQIIKQASSGSAVVLAIASQETNSIKSDYPFGDVNPIEMPKLKAPVLDARGTRTAAPPVTAVTQANQFVPQANFLKTGDAANYGVFKMNWTMIKQTPTGMRLVGEARRDAELAHRPVQDQDVQSAVGRRVNADTALATVILQEAMKQWSLDPPRPDRNPEDQPFGNFWAGHRMGFTGLYRPSEVNWEDVRDYYNGVQAILRQIQADPHAWTSSDRWGTNVPNI